MEVSRSVSRAVVVLMLVLLTLMVVTASPSRITVGSRQGWSPNVNFTLWAQDKQFYYDDWLFFVYDRNQQSVLEVNQTNYETCNAEHPLHNYRTGAGRDVVHLNVARNYYFIGGNGFCYSGMKLAIHVEKTPPTPPVPASNNSPALMWSTLNAQLVVPATFAAAALWHSF